MIAVIFGGIIFGGIVSAEDADRRWCWPDLIVATGPEAAHTAQRAARSIAIVATADDMVASGLVTSIIGPLLAQMQRPSTLMRHSLGLDGLERAPSPLAATRGRVSFLPPFGS